MRAPAPAAHQGGLGTTCSRISAGPTIASRYLPRTLSECPGTNPAQFSSSRPAKATRYRQSTPRMLPHKATFSKLKEVLVHLINRNKHRKSNKIKRHRKKEQDKTLRGKIPNEMEISNLSNGLPWWLRW